MGNWNVGCDDNLKNVTQEMLITDNRKRVITRIHVTRTNK